MGDTTAVMLQDRLNDIERNICDGIDFRQELNEAYALADELDTENKELRDENAKLREFVVGMWRLFVEHCDMDESHLAEVDAVRDGLSELGIEVPA